jgi:hypothetical protein
MRRLLLVASHLLIGAAGFAAGIYLLPVLTAPPAPSKQAMMTMLGTPAFEGEFRRDLKGSDFLHWGEGTVYVSRSAIALEGRIAPGPDYKLYLAPAFVETEAEFEKLRPKMRRVGDVRTFENFVVALPADIDLQAFNTVIVWCEAFGQFITAARYR